MVSNLYITHHPTNCKRQQELELCLNLNEGSFDRVFVFSEQTTRPDWYKGMWLTPEHRLTFADVIKYCNMCGRDDINVIANADLIIPTKAVDLIKKHLQHGECYALAKWDITPKGIRPWTTGWSQDMWCFRGKVRSETIGNYYFGLPGCDNRFAYELQQTGYKVLNPSESIETYHLHLSNLRTQTNDESHRVMPAYLLVTPHRLGEEPKLETYTKRNFSPLNKFNSLW